MFTLGLHKAFLSVFHDIFIETLEIPCAAASVRT